MILLAGVVGWIFVPAGASSWQVAHLAIAFSVLLLGQGLLRDLVLLLRRNPQPSVQPAARCLCLESTIGVAGVLAAAVLVLLDVYSVVILPRWLLGMALPTVLLLGFILKDWVIQGSPLRLRRVKDHRGLAVRW